MAGGVEVIVDYRTANEVVCVTPPLAAFTVARPLAWSRQGGDRGRNLVLDRALRINMSISLKLRQGGAYLIGELQYTYTHGLEVPSISQPICMYTVW